MNLHDMVQRSDTAAGRWFDRAVLLLIVVSVISMSFSTIPGLSPSLRTALEAIKYLIIALFTIEYGLRIVTADRRWKYFFSCYGIIDLAALSTCYLTLVWAGMMDLRALRTLHLLRLFRAFELARYTTALARIGSAVRYARYEATVFLFATLVLLYIAAMGIHHFESQAQPEKFDSVFNSLWWAIVTLTTVGYGDAYPITVGGRIWTIFVLFLGMGIVAVPAGLMATGLSRAIEEERAEARRIEREAQGDGERGNRG